LSEKAFDLLPVNHWLRAPFIRFVRWKMLEGIMLVFIVANCITLAMGSNKPGFDESNMGQGLRVANYIFIGAFALEMCCKIIALGFAFGPHTYLRYGGCTKLDV
jgi:hypothetical protein